MSFVRLHARWLLGLLLLIAGAARAQTYILATPDAALNSDSWSLSSPNMAGFRAAITNPAYFGAGGTVNTAISVEDLATISPATLTAVHGLIVPWWSNTQSTPYVAAVTATFLGGMDLWLLEDDAQHNAIGTALGLVSSSASGAASNGTAPFFSGPFGTATNTQTYGNFAQFDEATVLALGGTVIGRNLNGEVTAVYWARGTFAPAAGALIVFSDVDMVSNWSADPYNPTLSANGILALNTTAAMVQAVPEPGTLALIGLGLAWVMIAARRRRGV